MESTNQSSSTNGKTKIGMTADVMTQYKFISAVKPTWKTLTRNSSELYQRIASLIFSQPTITQ